MLVRKVTTLNANRAYSRIVIPQSCRQQLWRQLPHLRTNSASFMWLSSSPSLIIKTWEEVIEH